ncbi:hypothetical protein [Kocuria sp. NPDC057446]|uniref:hypothetical protein n=1 Tax=Kocuria sp. NPDC057446 TaxID=3346137 RepID=UPI0036A556E3
MYHTTAHLTSAELALVECMVKGTVFGPVTQSRVNLPVINARVIRDVLRGLYDDVVPDPKGLRLRCTRIAGRIDLDHLETRIPLELDQCEIPEGLTAVRARLASLRLNRASKERAASEEAVIHLEGLHVEALGLTRTHLVNEMGPALSADGLVVEADAEFKELSVRGRSSEGVVRLRGATVGGHLVLTGARLTNTSGPALYANMLTVKGSAYLDEDFFAQGNGPDGAVRLRGATVQGWLSLRNARLINETGPALVADRLTVASNAYLDKWFIARGNSRDEGTVQLTGATIGGQLLLTGARLSNESGSALVADRLTAHANMYLDVDFSARGCGPRGAVRLRGAAIKGWLSLSRSMLINESGPALVANSLTVGSNAYFDRQFIARGNSTEKGTVHLPGASIGGKLDMGAALITNKSGRALVADRLSVVANAYLNERFTARGHSAEDGAVHLHGATIGGKLDMRAASITNTSGPALYANELTVVANAYLNAGFTAQGSGPKGAIRLRGATFQGWLDITDALITNEAGPVLSADGVTIKQNLYIGLVSGDEGRQQESVSRNITKARNKRRSDHAAVVLTGAEVGATLKISRSTLDAARTSGDWDITGLTYRTLEAETAQYWLDFLRYGTRDYSPQPYQEFASFARSQGEERLTQKILIAQRDDQLSPRPGHGGQLTDRQKAALWVLRLTVGYGYRTWRALAWLAGLVVVAVVTTHLFGASRWSALRRPDDSKPEAEWETCQEIDLWLLGLETIPLVPLLPVEADHCTIIDTPQGTIYLVVSMVLKILAWALVTLFIAGYSNIVRKPGP